MKDKNKLIVLVSGIVVILLMVVSVSFAIFRFGTDSTNQQLVLGDIWMKYTESNGISLENALPGDLYTNYFEFTITGTNTYTKKDIYYDISLTHGDVPAGKIEENRIEDKYLKFKLTEVVANTETEIFTDKTYDDLNNKRVHVDTISKSTNEYSKTYRLYMVISEELTYGNSSNAILTTEEFGKIFGSVKVNVTGDFNEKDIENNDTGALLVDTFKGVLETRTNSYTEDTDGTIYISGKQDDYDSSTTDDIDFNYVWYSGKLWRITTINPDGTMKMITEDNITAIAYGEDTNFYTKESTTSWIYQWLNEDFLDTLYNYENIIKTDSTWNVTSGNGTISTKLAETTMVPAKVGLLNSYEYYKSYEILGNDNYENGYLNIGYFWWLSNPYNVASTSNVWSVDIFGYATSNEYTTSSVSYGARPSINLKSTIQLVGGTGIKSNPYRIKGDREDVKPNTTLLNTRSSGEYVNFDGNLYRIVEIENNTTKINKIDYIRDDSNTVINKYLMSSTPFGLNTNTQGEDYWDYYLNNTWYNSITEEYKSMLETGNYYLGIVGSGNGYKLAICATVSNTVSTKDCEKTTSTWSGYVGLPRYGEMFSSQLGGGFSSSSDMWLITPATTSNGWSVSNHGIGKNNNPFSRRTYGVRPSANLKSTIIIESGSGTEKDPFEIGLPN